MCVRNTKKMSLAVGLMDSFACPLVYKLGEFTNHSDRENEND